MKVATNMGGIYLGNPLFDTVMEEWNRRQALVIIHPCRARKRPENVITGVSGMFASMRMMETVDVRAEFEKLYFDVAGDPEPVQLKMLRMVAADDHIVYGSDFPHSPAKVIIAKKKHFDTNTDYDDIREKIYADNAIKLLGKEKE